MVSSFTQKQLRATLTLPGTNQTFPGTGANTLQLTNLRMTATLTGTVNWTNFLALQIYGMKQADMNAVTILWAGPNPTALNTRALIVLESNDGSGWKQVFQGQFQQAAPDYHSLPDVNLNIYAAAGYGFQVASASPVGYPGTADVVTILTTLADEMNVKLENNGVTGQLSTPYLSGTTLDQFKSVCTAAGVDYYFDFNGNLAITPRNAPRSGKTAINLSRTSGMIGYPTIQQYGVNVRCLFNPAIFLGCPVQIESDVPGATGQWIPQKAVHQLDANKPGGSWFSSLDCFAFPAAA